MRRDEKRLCRAIFLTALSVYLLTSGREPPWGDGHVQYMVAESLVHHGGIDVPRPWPDDFPPGRGGKYYSTYPIMTSLVQVPGLALLDRTARSGPAHRFAEPLTSHLAPALFGALCCALFFGLCRRRGVSLAAASTATVMLAFGTTVWVYAHYSYSEIIQAAFFTGFLDECLRLPEEPTPARARWLGLWAGLLFSVKYIYAASLVGAAVYLAVRLRGRWRPTVRLLGWTALTAVPFLLLALIYNTLCWGGPLTTGYQPYFHSYWGESPLWGLWGMFLSPGKSVFLYSPPLILGLLALPRLWRRHRAACAGLLATAGPVLLVYAFYKLDGDYAWGPRFVVFMVPALGLSFAVLIDAWRGWTSRWSRRAARGALALFLAVGVGVQVLGLSLYWDHFIRISMDARTAWLGTPDRAGAIIPVRADGHCDSCFEDVHQLEWLPPFQPIAGHLWLLRSLAAGRDWKAAEADAPWHRHTSLTLPIKDSYQRARLDWWGMLWLRDLPQYRAVGVILLLLMAGGTGLGTTLWIRAHRSAAPAGDDGDGSGRGSDGDGSDGDGSDGDGDGESASDSQRDD